MVEQRGRSCARRGARANDERGDLAAGVGCVGGTSFAVLAASSLVPGDEDDGAAVGVLGAGQDGWQVAGQPAVAVGDRAVMHVVDEVGGYERERGQRVAS